MIKTASVKRVLPKAMLDEHTDAITTNINKIFGENILKFIFFCLKLIRSSSIGTRHSTEAVDERSFSIYFYNIVYHFCMILFKKYFLNLNLRYIS